MSESFDAVLMVGFGGPTRSEEIRPFLANVLRGRRVPPERLEEVVRHYEAIGGGSPYNAHTMRQASALRARLSQEGVELPVQVGMRNWEPYLRDVLRSLAGAGGRRILGVVLATHRCEASWERYLAAVDDGLAALGPSAPEIEYLDSWYDHPLFIQAVAARIREAMEPLSAARRDDARLVFTAHSIPVAMAAKSRYVQEIGESCRLVAAELGMNWTVAYQSRSGNPREPWLLPDLEHVLRAAETRTVIVVPIGFLCDHVEVVYDLDVEALALARSLGLTMRRAPTVGDHPLFIQMLSELIKTRIAEDSGGGRQGGQAEGGRDAVSG